MNAHPQIIENVRSRLAAAGLSASKAAALAGISSTTLTRPLNDARHRFVLSTSTLQALCAPLQCELADLVNVPPRSAEGTVATITRLSELREQIEEVIDLLHALDKIGDGIGEADGYSVSAVAQVAGSCADNARDMVEAMMGVPGTERGRRA